MSVARRQQLNALAEPRGLVFPSTLGRRVEVATVSTADQSLLVAVREALRGADEALLCVAFVHERGVRLVEDELRQLGRRARLVATTTFDQSNGHALACASILGTQIKTLNPGAGSTYHPKLYLARHGKHVRAVVGSANLTGGLATNVELAVSMRGEPAAEPLRRLEVWAESMWSDPRSADWMPAAADIGAEDGLAPELFDAIREAWVRNPVFHTLGPRPRPNYVAEVTRSEVLVETEQSKSQGRAPQPIPAWMFNIAWDFLRSRGEISNRVLLNHLRVHRSSAVCAILARVPGVTALSRPVGLRLEPNRRW